MPTLTLTSHERLTLSNALEAAVSQQKNQPREVYILHKVWDELGVPELEAEVERLKSEYETKREDLIRAKSKQAVDEKDVLAIAEEVRDAQKALKDCQTELPKDDGKILSFPRAVYTWMVQKIEKLDGGKVPTDVVMVAVLALKMYERDQAIVEMFESDKQEG